MTAKIPLVSSADFTDGLREGVVEATATPKLP